MTSSQVALLVIQQAICKLARWVEVDLPEGCQPPDDHNAIARAKELLSWPKLGKQPQALQVLFDQVQLSHGQKEKYYWPASYIEAGEDEYPTIPYPQKDKPDINLLKASLKEAIKNLDISDWGNLSLLTLILEKYGSHLSFGEEDVALIDITRATAAVAAALAHEPDASHLTLIAGGLSGIQKFIYTISSDGALKSLRARSFYLELVTEEVVQQLLEVLELPRTNVIYAGGGNLYILAEVGQTKEKVEQVRQQFNQWLFKEFQGKVFLALDCKEFKTEALEYQETKITNKDKKNFAYYWSEATKQLASQKAQKFSEQIGELLEANHAYEPCRVCHRDDVKTLKPLNQEEEDSALACGTCRRMYRLGGQLLRVEAIVRSQREEKIPHAIGKLSFSSCYYYLLDSSEVNDIQDDETVFLINNWTVKHYRQNNTINLLLGNYGRPSQIPEESGFMRTSEMAEKARGIKRVGYLRMDVDRLGRIFAEGLDKKQTLPRIGGLSRLMSYFFKVYLNSLAKSRQTNFLEQCQTIEVLKRTKYLSEDDRLNLLFIYAGGDDLFICGRWNEVVEFGFDVYQCFRAYTGHHPDITLSGGISLAVPKFPLYQAAAESGKAEDAAKDNGRDSLGLFGQVFKWDEWLGIADLEVIDQEIRGYLRPETKPELFGIFPFVEWLENQKIEVNYSRSFVRNLLATAQIQEQMSKEIKENRKKEEYANYQKDVRYFLHLPKIAYTLARLPQHVLTHKDFEPVRISLKSPYNAPYFRAIATWIELLNRS